MGRVRRPDGRSGLCPRRHPLHPRHDAQGLYSIGCSTGFSTVHRTLCKTKRSVENPVEQSVEIQLN